MIKNSQNKMKAKALEIQKNFYSVVLTANPPQFNKQIHKTLAQYKQLEKQLQEFTFDIGDQLSKIKENQQQSSEIMEAIVLFMNECCCGRQDVRDSRIFNDFIGLQGREDCEYLQEWDRATIQTNGAKICQFDYQPTSRTLIILQKVDNPVKKITNFFKSWISPQAKSSRIKIYQCHKKWKQTNQLKLQADPLKFTYCSKSGLLLITTEIGLYIFSLNLSLSTSETISPKLLQFVKFFNIRHVALSTHSQCFYATNQIVYMRSINKEVSVEVSQSREEDIGGIAVEGSGNRLFVCCRRGLIIYDVGEFGKVRQLACIQNVSNFSYLHFSQNDKYLFGLSETGFISVLELKPYGLAKQHLISTLTNIDCPSLSPFLSYHEKGQMLITAYRNKITLISTKNEPIYSGGTHTHKITAGIYNEDSNSVCIADEGGNIVFYNIKAL